MSWWGLVADNVIIKTGTEGEMRILGREHKAKHSDADVRIIRITIDSFPVVLGFPVIRENG